MFFEKTERGYYCHQRDILMFGYLILVDYDENYEKHNS